MYYWHETTPRLHHRTLDGPMQPAAKRPLEPMLSSETKNRVWKSHMKMTLSNERTAIAWLRVGATYGSGALVAATLASGQTAYALTVQALLWAIKISPPTMAGGMVARFFLLVFCFLLGDLV